MADNVPNEDPQNTRSRRVNHSYAANRSRLYRNSSDEESCDEIFKHGSSTDSDSSRERVGIRRRAHVDESENDDVDDDSVQETAEQPTEIYNSSSEDENASENEDGTQDVEDENECSEASDYDTNKASNSEQIQDEDHINLQCLRQPNVPALKNVEMLHASTTTRQAQSFRAPDQSIMRNEANRYFIPPMFPPFCLPPMSFMRPFDYRHVVPLPPPFWPPQFHEIGNSYIPAPSQLLRRVVEVVEDKPPQRCLSHSPEIVEITKSTDTPVTTTPAADVGDSKISQISEPAIEKPQMLYYQEVDCLNKMPNFSIERIRSETKIVKIITEVVIQGEGNERIRYTLNTQLNPLNEYEKLVLDLMVMPLGVVFLLRDREHLFHIESVQSTFPNYRGYGYGYAVCRFVNFILHRIEKNGGCAVGELYDAYRNGFTESSNILLVQSYAGRYGPWNDTHFLFEDFESVSGMCSFLLTRHSKIFHIKGENSSRDSLIFIRSQISDVPSLFVNCAHKFKSAHIDRSRICELTGFVSETTYNPLHRKQQTQVILPSDSKFAGRTVCWFTDNFKMALGLPRIKNISKLTNTTIKFEAHPQFNASGLEGELVVSQLTDYLTSKDRQAILKRTRIPRSTPELVKESGKEHEKSNQKEDNTAKGKLPSLTRPRRLS